MAMIFIFITSVSTTVINSPMAGQTQKHMTIFDSIGEMASGMAYIHVAIPLNLSTFHIQAEILGKYLFQLSRVVDNDTLKDGFLASIREIAKFGMTKLQRIKNRVTHLDNILPFDGDLTRRARMTHISSFIEDEVIDYEGILDNRVKDPITMDQILTDPNTLKATHEIVLKRKIDSLKAEAEAFFKAARDNNLGRFKRAALDSVYVSQIQLFADLQQLQKQHIRLRQTQKQILDNTVSTEQKLNDITNKQWHAGMDNYEKTTDIYDILHKDLDAFRTHLAKSFQDFDILPHNQRSLDASDYYIQHDQFIDTHNDTTTQPQIYNKTALKSHLAQAYTEYKNATVMANNYQLQNNISDTHLAQPTNNTLTFLDLIAELDSPNEPEYYEDTVDTEYDYDYNDTTFFSKHRSKRFDYKIDTADMLIPDNITLQLILDYHNLQIEVTDLIITTIADIRYNMDIHRRYKKYKQLQNTGKAAEFFSMDQILKSIPNSTRSDSNDTNDTNNRHKRAVPIVAMAIIAGVLGTFLGMYNTWEIQNLKARLNEMDKNHNLLVHVTQRQEEQINRITENMNAICALITMMAKNNPTLIAEQISSQISLFETRLTMATNAVQQLQHRRLAIDMLDTQQLTEMHNAVLNVAKERGYHLMPERISDYFQIEVSYLRKGDDILIMMHVPCIIHDQLLTVYKYVPLPFPIPKFLTTDSATIADLISGRSSNRSQIDRQDMDALIIIPEMEMIAVGRSDKFKVLSQADLAACIKRNKIYLCEKHQVLHTNLQASCLGSIYSNYEQGIKENCKLERRKLKETVYQLSPTDHLVFTPQPYNAKIECRNGSSFPVYLTQVHKLTVPEDCKINLKSHTITSDYNIRVSPPALDVPWTLDPMQLPANILLDAAIIDRKISELDINLKNLLNETSQRTNFLAMLNTGLGSPFTYPWFIWVALVAGAAALILLVGWCVLNKIQERKYQKNLQTPVLQMVPQDPNNPNPNQHTQPPKQGLYPPTYNL